MMQPNRLLSVFFVLLAYTVSQNKGTCASSEEVGHQANLSILLVPISFASHMMGLANIGEELVSRGHNVTFCVFAGIGLDELPQNLAKRTGMNLLTVGSDRPSSGINVQEIVRNLQNVTLTRGIPQIMELLSNFTTELFLELDTPRMASWDIIVDDFTSWPVSGYLSRKWNIPTMHVIFTLDYSVGHLPSWPYPLCGTGFPNDFTFPQRLLNTLVSAFFPFAEALIYHLSKPPAGGIENVTISHSLLYPGVGTPMIVPTSFGFEYPRPTLPLIHYVGPILEREGEPLSGPLQAWLASRPDRSVIYISMGTAVELSESDATALVHAILATDYSALWSIRQMDIQSLIHQLTGDEHENRIFTSSWVPQRALPGHKAIVMSILHGGLFGVMQSLLNGVPIVVIPFAADHFDVAARVVSSGAGVRLHTHEVTAERLTESITTVSTSPYREAAERLQKILANGGGVERVAELVEFYASVGYEHLIPAYAKYNWSWVEYYNVDVCTLLCTTFVVIVFITYRACICTVRKCSKSIFKKKQE